MNTTTQQRFTLTNEQAQELARDTGYGSPGTLDIGNGYIMKLSFDYDDMTQISDFDCYGKVLPADYRTWNGQVSPRPDDFDGMAELITYDRGEAAWWQPPSYDKEDRRRWHTDKEYRDSLRRLVTDVLSYGFHLLKLELCNGTDAYGNLVVVGYAIIGGIEPFPDADTLAGYAIDLSYEIEVAQ